MKRQEEAKQRKDEAMQRQKERELQPLDEESDEALPESLDEEENALSSTAIKWNLKKLSSRNAGASVWIERKQDGYILCLQYLVSVPCSRA